MKTHLTPKKISAIKRIYAQQGGRHGIIAMLARQFNVSRPAIYRALDSYQTIEASVTFEGSGTGVPNPQKEGVNSQVTETKRYTSTPTKTPCPDPACKVEWCGMVCVTCGATLSSEVGPPLLGLDLWLDQLECGACGQVYNNTKGYGKVSQT